MSAFWTHSPALAVAIPLFAAFLVLFLSRIRREAAIALSVGAMALDLVLALGLVHLYLTRGTVVYVFGASNPSSPLSSAGIPIRIIFEVDGMGSFMALIFSVLGLASAIYAATSEKGTGAEAKFHTLLLLMVAGMMGMALTGDMFNFFVFLEVNSLASAALVAYRIEDGRPVEAGFKYAVISAVGALLFLLAVGILYAQYDNLNMAYVASRITMSNLDKVAMALVVSALAMKAGAIPLHMWVPDSYGRAPGPIPSMLVVASQASLYGLFRFSFDVFGLAANRLALGWFLIILGLLSMFVGVTMAIVQKEIKRLMAYHAISQTGYMLLGVGVGLATLGTPAFSEYGLKAMEGGIFHIINHAMYKGLLFMTASAIAYSAGTTEIKKLGGLGHRMPFTMIFFLIGAFSISGLPPFNGFASKLMIYESVYRFNPLLSVVAILVSIITLASFMKVFQSVFTGPAPEGAREVPRPMLLAMGVLAFVIFLFGLFPGLALKYLVGPAAQSLADQLRYVSRIMGVVG